MNVLFAMQSLNSLERLKGTERFINVDLPKMIFIIQAKHEILNLHFISFQPLKKNVFIYLICYHLGACDVINKIIDFWFIYLFFKESK